MAKLGIALCILFAVSGVRGLNIMASLTAGQLADAKEYILKADAAAKKVDEDYAKVTETGENAKKDITSSIQAVVDATKDKIEALSISTEIRTKCVASDIDVNEIAKNYVNEVISCIDNNLADIKSDYDKVKASLTTFSRNSKSIVGALTQCQGSDSVENVLTCYFATLGGSDANLNGEWKDLSKLITSFERKSTNFQTTLGSCRAAAALTTFKTQVNQFIAQIEKCIADSQ